MSAKRSRAARVSAKRSRAARWAEPATNRYDTAKTRGTNRPRFSTWNFARRTSREDWRRVSAPARVRHVASKGSEMATPDEMYDQAVALKDQGNLEAAITRF